MASWIAFYATHARVGPDGLAQRHDLVGGGVGGGGDGQAGGQGERAHLHGLGGETLHLAQLFGGGGPVFRSARGNLQGGVADLGSDVDADAAGLEGGGPVVQGVPLPHGVADEGPADVVLEGLGAALACREGGVAAVAGDLGRHALVGLALAAGVVEQRDVGVGVHVDEARAYDVPGGVDAAGRLGVC